MANWNFNAFERLGEITELTGLHCVAEGPPQVFSGELCEILDDKDQILMRAEVTGFNKGKVFLMPHSHQSLRMGDKVRATGKGLSLKAGSALLGRIINAYGEPIDESGPLRCPDEINLSVQPINPLHRLPIDSRITTGINAIDALFPLGRGQRIGIFAGSGVGKSTLMGLLANQMDSDLCILCFTGERGREVNDFIQTHLPEDARKKTVVIAACSDESALMRRQAVYTATAIAEYFCRQGMHLSLFIDSITRFAMAQREISLSLGEPPTARGYTPSCFARLPGLVERAGSFRGQGSITALYTVLVEGDDFNEPIADHMRSLLDGHIILSRDLAHRGAYPAISLLESISRLQKQLLTTDEQGIAKKILSILSIYQQNRELIELGAWQKGQNPALDEAIEKMDELNALFYQGNQKGLPLDELFIHLKGLLS